jgi:predicted nucleic acid-binding Zn ribbon protein
MEVKFSEIFKAIIPQTQMCRDLLKDIFQKEYHRQKKKAWPMKRCAVCYKNNRRKGTLFCCPECEAALCVEKSFKAFHTKPKYLGKILLHIQKA